MRREPLALQTDFDAPEQVSEVYADPLPTDGDGEFEDHEDDDHIHMIEHSLGLICDCGNPVSSNNRCTNCGAQAPWASKLGCGLA